MTLPNRTQLAGLVMVGAVLTTLALVRACAASPL